MFHRIGNDGTRYSGKNGAGILFTDGKQVLLLKRAKGDHKEAWGQPGGGVEDGETPIDAAIREAKEECGNFSGYRVTDFEEKDGIHRWTTYIYKVAGPFNCNLSDEHSEYKWFDLDQLKSVNLHPQFKKNLPAYLSMINRKIPQPLGTFREWLRTQSSL